MSSLREFLQARQRELNALILPLRKEIALQEAQLRDLEAELAEIEKSAAAIGMVNGVQKSSYREKAVREGTIKDFAVQVLSDHPGGLVALDILVEINERFNTEFPRTSLSPQLSRLKHEGLIDRRGVVWFLVDQNKKGSDDSSEPFVGDMAERPIASDSQSEEPSSGKNTSGSGGSNPPVSAFHRAKESLLSGSNLFGPLNPLEIPFTGKKGG